MSKYTTIPFQVINKTPVDFTNYYSTLNSNSLFDNLNFLIDEKKQEMDLNIENIFKPNKLKEFIDIIPLSLLTPPHNANTHFFNQNKFINPLTHQEVSDTSGDLKGVVYFAQNSIIPAINRIEGDRQSTLVPHRKTLVMFKPQHAISSKENVYVKVIDPQGNEIHTQKLLPPSMLPKVSYRNVYKTNLEATQFHNPGSFDVEIDNAEQLTQILTNPNYFNKLVEQQNIIKIDFNNIILNDWVKPLHINSDPKYQGKNIVLQNHTNSDISIRYSNKNYTLKQQDTVQFICDVNGRWLTESDTKQLKKRAAEKSAPNKLDYKSTDISISNFNENFKYDEVINEKENLIKMKHSTQFMKDLLAHNQREIRVDIDDNNWVDSIKLPDGNHYCYITFNTTASKPTNIYFDNKQIELKKGAPINLDFIMQDKKWRSNPLVVLPEQINNLEYMEETWSTSISKEYIQPNLKLEFIHNDKTGTLSDITIGAPTKLTLHLLDIGVFTPPRDNFDFMDTAELNRQFYQNIPVSTLQVNRYDPTYVDSVVFGDGTILQNVIPENGGWHERSIANITRQIYGEGIHMATSGINSSPDNGPTFVPTPQMVIYNAIGRYQNGLVVHGGTGSYVGGLASVEDSVGNEFSHELGHNFDLIDFYGGGRELGIHRRSHERNSTWGWDADNNMFLPNFDRSGRASRDAMNGGSPNDNDNNAYTLYTPNTLAAIQKRLEKLYTFAPEASTGYQKWDPATQRMENTHLALPHFLQFNVPVTNGKDISQCDLYKMLEKYDSLKIQLGNGYHSPNIYLPRAEPRNEGNTITIKTFAEWSSHIVLNGIQEEIKQNETITYVSDGKTWNKTEDVGFYRPPIKQDVPVITVLGYYDPENQILVTDPSKQKSNHIQDILYGSSGMVYKANDGLDACSSYIEFDLEDGTTRQYKLYGTNFNKSRMNRFHINIERELNPTKVKIFINGELKDSVDIERRSLTLPTTINGLTV
ncbi:M66 family metalloprotease [Providencia rettgeri]|uniref:M66 family metalloprotease n=1 Tax=Providencia rettgeri TaxID=587 RepID=UPI0034E0C10C